MTTSLALCGFTLGLMCGCARAPLETQVVSPETRAVLLDPKRPDFGIIEMVHVPSGMINTLDAEGCPQEHKLKGFWIAQFETRWDEYLVFAWGLDFGDDREAFCKLRAAGERPSGPMFAPDAGWGVKGMPANNITPFAARAYCKWLSQRTGKTFRLPTSTEWEYACRAGGPPMKLNEESLKKAAWFAANSDAQAHAVGKKQPNAWGLYDMLGNVGELVIAEPGQTKGVIAGGTWKDDAAQVHSGAREDQSREWIKNDPSNPPERDWFDYDSAHYIGLRVVMEE